MPAAVRTATVFTVRDRAWTDADGITHRLVAYCRTACEPTTDKPEDLRDKTPWKRPDCIDCIAIDLRPGSYWAVLQEAVLAEEA